MATERTLRDPRIAAQASVLKSWGQAWRTSHGTSQQDLGRAAGYGSDVSPKSAAVAVSRIESGKTEPSGRYRRQLLDVLGRSEEELREATESALADRTRQGPLARALAGPVVAENEVRRAQILGASTALTQRVAFQGETAEQVFERTRTEFVLPFLEHAATIDWGALLDPPGEAPDPFGGTSTTTDVRAVREQTRRQVLRAVSGVDARPGGATAAGILTTVSTAATASTTTAIASLAGGAGSSATLAWLGSGSLPAGGMGLVGGTAVLTGIVALPALLALGGVLVWKGRRLRRAAEAEAEKLDAAQQALEDMAEAVDRAGQWHDAQQDVIQFAGLLGRTIQARVVDPESGRGAAGTADRIPWDGLPDAVREALEIQLRLVSIILDARALPIWLGVSSVGHPEATDARNRAAMKSEEWVRTSLALARRDLEVTEEWLRRRL